MINDSRWWGVQQTAISRDFTHIKGRGLLWNSPCSAAVEKVSNIIVHSKCIETKHNNNKHNPWIKYDLVTYSLKSSQSKAQDQEYKSRFDQEIFGPDFCGSFWRRLLWSGFWVRFAPRWGVVKHILFAVSACLQEVSYNHFPQIYHKPGIFWLKHGWSMVDAWPSHFSRISAAASRGRCSRLGDLPQRGGAAVVVPAKGAGHGGDGGAEVPRQQGDLPFLGFPSGINGD